MKLVSFLSFLLFSTLVFSQKLECCKTVYEVQELIYGKWKALGDDSNKAFVYSFKNGKGDLEVNYGFPYGLDNSEEHIIVAAHGPAVEILKKRKKFKIKYTYMLETIIADIKFLSRDKMILFENKIKTEYYKIDE